jgi:hypothetical protein
MSNDPEAARMMPSNFQGGGQGYYQAPVEPSFEMYGGDSQANKNLSDMDKLAEIHNKLNGSRGGM